MTFNAEVQERPNGPWTEEFRERVSRVREASGMSLKVLGERFGFSGPFTHGLLAGKQGHHMASKHCGRVLNAMKEMEVEAGFRERSPTQVTAEMTLDQLVTRIHAFGFSVELKPLQ